jgi:hypothetical protein
LWIDPDEIEADDPRVLGDRLERVAQLGIGHAVRLGGHVSRYQREVEDVNIDADIDGGALRHHVGETARLHLVEFRHRHHAVAVIDRVLDHRRRVAQAAYADLGQALDMLHRRCGGTHGRW